MTLLFCARSTIYYNAFSYDTGIKRKKEATCTSIVYIYIYSLFMVDLKIDDSQCNSFFLQIVLRKKICTEEKTLLKNQNRIS